MADPRLITRSSTAAPSRTRCSAGSSFRVSLLRPVKNVNLGRPHRGGSLGSALTNSPVSRRSWPASTPPDWARSPMRFAWTATPLRSAPALAWDADEYTADRAGPKFDQIGEVLDQQSLADRRQRREARTTLLVTGLSDTPASRWHQLQGGHAARGAAAGAGPGRARL